MSLRSGSIAARPRSKLGALASLGTPGTFLARQPGYASVFSIGLGACVEYRCRVPHCQRSGGRLIPFTKAHACGNDFLIVAEEAAGRPRSRRSHAPPLPAQHRHWRRRRRVLRLDESKSRPGPNSGRVRLHNADGSIAEISGNGTRCVAAWMAEALNSQPGDTLEITTDAGPRVCRIDSCAATVHSRSTSPPAWACPVRAAHAQAH